MEQINYFRYALENPEMSAMCLGYSLAMGISLIESAREMYRKSELKERNDIRRRISEEIDER